MALRELTPEERDRMRLKADEGSSWLACGPTARPRMPESVRGTWILEVNRTPVKRWTNSRRAIATVTEDKPLLLLLRRNNGVNHYASLAAK